jgi:hypothetical protein
MEFNTKDCSWSVITITLLGRKITGLRGFSVKKTVEKEHVYASGDEPVDIQSGNKKYEGDYKMLKYEVDMLNDAAQAAGYVDITEVPHELITSTIEYKKNAVDKIRTTSVLGISFTELSEGMEQNSKMHEISLPYLAMRVLRAPRVGG